MILLVFGISYAISASVGHYFIYSEEGDSQLTSIMGYDEIQRLKFYENAALHAREAVFVINQKLEVVTRVGLLSDEDAAAFRQAYIEDNPANLSILQDLFTAESSESFLRMLPERLFFLNKKWNLKNVYDNMNNVLYVYLIDEETFKYMIIDITDLVNIFECDKTSVIDRIDEYLMRTREVAISKSIDVLSLREMLVRKLKLLVMHIAEMDLAGTSEGLSHLIDQIITYKKNSLEDFIHDFGEEVFLAVTKKDREKILLKNGENTGSYEFLTKQGLALEQFDSYFSKEPEVWNLTRDILLQIKETHTRKIVYSYVDALMQNGRQINRKLNPMNIEFDIANEDFKSIYKILPEILPIVESEIMDPSQSPSERLKVGKSENITVSFSIYSAEQSLSISIQSDSSSLNEMDIQELSQGRYIRSGDMISGDILQDEGKVVPNLGKCLKAIEILGGKVEFKVNAGVSTEFIFTIPKQTN